MMRLVWRRPRELTQCGKGAEHVVMRRASMSRSKFELKEYPRRTETVLLGCSDAYK